MMETIGNILMIGGNARKSGKTTLICRLLEAFGNQYKIAAIKVALYDDAGDFGEHHPQALPAGYQEVRETDPTVVKDSGKYLASGASESWFFAALPQSEKRVTDQIREISKRADLVILESNTLRKKIKPGRFVLVNHPGRDTKKSARELASLVDYTLDTGSFEFTNVHQFIGIEDKSWSLKKLTR